jgi:hypothetical protein
VTGAASASEECHVCGESADSTNSVLCNHCGLRFHLKLRQNEPGVDCGNVWVNEDSLALEFACFPCLRGECAPGEEEPPLGAGH